MTMSEIKQGKSITSEPLENTIDKIKTQFPGMHFRDALNKLAELRRRE